MRTLAVMLTLWSLAATAETDPFLDARVVMAAAAKGEVPGDPTAPAWDAAPARRFPLSAQRTVALPDAAANRALTLPGAGALTVRALVSAGELAVRVEWADGRPDAPGDDVNSFADSVAMQVPVTFGTGHRLPHVGMGDAAMPVLVTLARRGLGTTTVVSSFVAAGFGSLTRSSSLPRTEAGVVHDAATGTYRAVIRRPLTDRGHSVDAGLVPVAWAVWDGSRGERGGYKQLTGWHFIRLPGREVDPAYLAEMAFGYRPGDLGDARKGQATAEAVCIACHHLPGKKLAPAGVAPDLAGIGAIATPGYLKASLTHPSEVVVQNLHLNAHYTPSAPPDRTGGRPSAEAYAWSTTQPDGQRVSKMPPFGSLGEDQVKDLVAYLTTLTGTP